jgi:molybdate transport system ATP-binding protein
MAMLSPEVQEAYRRNQINLSGREIVKTGKWQTFYLYQDISKEQKEHVQFLFKSLEIEFLADKPFAKMSNGEQKKILVARALSLKPKVLILDEFLQGLDRQSLGNWIDFLGQIGKHGVQMLISSHDFDLPQGMITHICCLDKARISFQGAWNQSYLETGIGYSPKKKQFNYLKADANSEKKDKHIAFLQISDVSVCKNNKTILENVDWTISEAEHWAILGPNGSGKTSLLKLILGQIHPYEGKGVVAFGPNADFSTAQMKSRIGYVGPELHSEFYEPNISVWGAVSTGLFIGRTRHLKLSPEQESKVKEALKRVGMLDKSLHRIFNLSYGEYQKVLLARAIVNDPWMLLLDEPCNGLDKQAKDSLLQIIDSLAQSNTCIVQVSHNLRELPACITDALELEQGKVVAKIQAP